MFCECGCGGLAPIAPRSRSWLGHIKGQPVRFIVGHGIRKDLPTRFWASVVKSEGCWQWIGNRINSGYGLIGDHGRNRTVHRLSWELHYGPIPTGLWVLHRCDNKICVRPDHLFLGTRSDNVKDMIIKDRANKKLSVEKVKEVLDLAAQGWNYPQIAARFGVNRNTIGNVVRGENWYYVTGRGQ